MSSFDFDLDQILDEFQDYEPGREEPAEAPEIREEFAPVLGESPAEPEEDLPGRESEAAVPAESGGDGSAEPVPTRRRERSPRQKPEIGPALRDLGRNVRSGWDRAQPRLRSMGGSVRSGWERLLPRLSAFWEKFRTAMAEQDGNPPTVNRLISAGLLLLGLLCALWVLNNVHPGSGTVVRGKPKVELSSRIAPEAVFYAPGEESEEPARKHYVIERDAVAAPAPNPACFGKISIQEPEKMMEIIQRARDSGLLGEDETVAFDPSAAFYYDEDIEYYLDDTILVICWKEVIAGNTCSFAEIKLADASQFRRKFADDTFASANQYYSTELHKSTNAVLSLNADFYQNRDFGVVVYNSKLYRFPTGTYTGTYKKYNCLETCFVNDKGDFLFTELGQVFTQEELEQYIAENNILFSISFGPVLVRDGQVRQVDWYPVGEINKGYSRAGIGQVDKLHYLYMSLNHSAESQARWTVNQFAQHFGEKPVINAYCLDGGQTAEIVFQGRPYNHVDYGKERPVSDNIFFATAIGGTEVSG